VHVIIPRMTGSREEKGYLAVMRILCGLSSGKTLMCFFVASHSVVEQMRGKERNCLRPDKIVDLERKDMGLDWIEFTCILNGLVNETIC